MDRTEIDARLRRMEDAMFRPLPYTPTVELSDDTLIQIAGNKIVRWGDIKNEGFGGH